MRQLLVKQKMQPCFCTFLQGCSAFFSYFRGGFALLYPVGSDKVGMAGQLDFHRLILATVASVALLQSGVASAQTLGRGQRLPSIEVNLEVLNSLRYGAPVANGAYAGGIGQGLPADSYGNQPAPAAPTPAPPPQQVVPYDAPQAANQGWYGGNTPEPQGGYAGNNPPPAPAPPSEAYGDNVPEWAQREQAYARRQMQLQEEQGAISTYQAQGMPNALPAPAASASAPAAKKYPKPKVKPQPDSVAETTAAMDAQLAEKGQPSAVVTPTPAPVVPAAPAMPEPVNVPVPAPTPEVPKMPDMPAMPAAPL